MASVGGDFHSLDGVVDAHAASHPHFPAVCDESCTWTYGELSDISKRLATVLRSYLPEECTAASHRAERPIAIALSRDCFWYACCVAAWRLNVPVIALSRDLPNAAAQQERRERVARELRPMLLIVGEGDPADDLPNAPDDCIVVRAACLLEASRAAPCFLGFSRCVSSPLLCYAYTGGTTKHSKCVAVTHSMALWEMRNYAIALHDSVKRDDRVLQYSSAYWGAAVFGQLDLALAHGACAVITTALDPGAIAVAVARYNVTVLGIVPSQLRGAWPGGPVTRPQGLRILISWAERLPQSLAKQWKAHMPVYELLIASEYWLTLYSDCTTWRDPEDGSERHVLRALPGLDMLLLTDDGKHAAEGEAGEMFLAGPTVSPGYVGPDGRIGFGPANDAAYTEIGGRRYLRTRDRLRRTRGDGLVYLGRTDSLRKRGGAWVDLDAIEASAGAVPGVAAAAFLADEATMEVFVQLETPPPRPLPRTLEEIRRTVGTACRLHILSELPLHPATAKVDRRALSERLAARAERERAHRERLALMQRQMLKAYSLYYCFVLALLFGSCLPFLSLFAALASTVGRCLLLPYLWAALLRVPDNFWWPYYASMADALLLTLLLMPDALLGPAALACCALLTYARDGRVLSVAVGSQSVLATALSVAMVLGSFTAPPSCVVVVVAVCAAASLAPRQASFFLALPVSCFLALPKWLRDDWAWSIEQKAPQRLWAGPLQRAARAWDASLVFDYAASRVEWSNDEVWSSVRSHSSDGGMAMTVDFWEELEPMSFSGGGAEARQTSAPENAELAAVNGNGAGTSILAGPLTALLDRVGAGRSAGGLGALDSLQAITFAEMIRLELGLVVSVADVLRSESVNQLATRLEAVEREAQNGGASALGARPRELEGEPDRDGAFRVYLMKTMSPVDWTVRYTGPGHLDVPALRRAIGRLCARHSALRAPAPVDARDYFLQAAMNKAAATWQLWASCLCELGIGGAVWKMMSTVVGAALSACWPRTLLPPTISSAAGAFEVRVPQELSACGESDSPDLVASRAIRRLTEDRRLPVACVVPVLLGEGNGHADATRFPPEAIAWYVYVGISHAYSDGASGQSLFGDLAKLYEEEIVDGAATRGPEPAEHLALLQRRLRASLRGRARGAAAEPNDEVYHDALCEDWGRRPGFQRRVRLSPPVLRALRASSAVLGCSIDIAWLTAIAGALLRLFPSVPCVRFVLKCPCRDGYGEAQMVGFLSEQRVFTIDVGNSKDATLLGVADMLNEVRRGRSWRAPEPYEAGLCVYVNIVSMMSPAHLRGFKHVMTSAGTQRAWKTDAYNHLNLRIDQVDEDAWDFRIFYWDASWQWFWSDYFAQALGCVIRDMATCPTAALVPDLLGAAAAVAAVGTSSSPVAAQVGAGDGTAARLSAGAVLERVPSLKRRGSPCGSAASSGSAGASSRRSHGSAGSSSAGGEAAGDPGGRLDAESGVETTLLKVPRTSTATNARASSSASASA